MFTDFIFVAIYREGFRLCPVHLHRSPLLPVVSSVQNLDSVLPPAVASRSFESVSGAQRGVSAATLGCELSAPCHETYSVNLGFVELIEKIKFREKCQVQLC